MGRHGRSVLGKCARDGVALFAAHAVAGCSKSPEPSRAPPDDVNANATIERIRKEQARGKVSVEREVRRSIQEDRVDAGVLAAAPPRAPEELGPSEGGDAGPARPGAASISGKLEASAPNQLIIRDHTGFEYRLKTDGRTRVTFNGRPAKLDQFKQGTEVRATYVFDQQSRVATAVEVLSPSDAGHEAGG